MPTMNVFARTQAELYQDPFKQQQPERSFESLLKELFALKPLTQENADMMARASAIKQELIDTLAGARWHRSNSLKRNTKPQSWRFAKPNGNSPLSHSRHLRRGKNTPGWKRCRE